MRHVHLAKMYVLPCYSTKFWIVAVFIHLWDVAGPPMPLAFHNFVSTALALVPHKFILIHHQSSVFTLAEYDVLLVPLLHCSLGCFAFLFTVSCCFCYSSAVMASQFIKLNPSWAYSVVLFPPLPWLEIRERTHWNTHACTQQKHVQCCKILYKPTNRHNTAP